MPALGGGAVWHLHVPRRPVAVQRVDVRVGALAVMHGAARDAQLLRVDVDRLDSCDGAAEIVELQRHLVLFAQQNLDGVLLREWAALFPLEKDGVAVRVSNRHGQLKERAVLQRRMVDGAVMQPTEAALESHGR